MVVSIRTRIVLGNHQTPSFVSQEFFEAVNLVAKTFEFASVVRPTTIRYGISSGHVVERPQDVYHRYDMDIDDVHLVPRCRRRKFLNRKTFKKKRPHASFDRFSVTTEEFNAEYFLLVPKSMYYDVEIYKHWMIRYLQYDGITWEIHFREVYVDPYDTSHTIWFFGTPKYQIVLCTDQDFRGREADLKRAILRLIPGAFHWD